MGFHSWKQGKTCMLQPMFFTHLMTLMDTRLSLCMTVVFLLVFRHLCFLCSAFFLRDRFSQGSRAEASELPML